MIMTYICNRKIRLHEPNLKKAFSISKKLKTILDFYDDYLKINKWGTGISTGDGGNISKLS